MERLADAAATNSPIDRETANWLQGVGPELHAKLAAVGLTQARQSAKVGDFLADYVESRRVGSKGTTVSNLNQARADLLRICDPNLDVRQFTPAMADAVLAGHAARGLAPATSAMYAKKLKMMFADAVRLGLSDANPFDGVRMPSEKPDAGRKHYVPREVVFTVIDRCTPDWELVAALSRFAGLRAPSEVLSLRWSDIDLANGVMVVRSPKTEHHKGGESRQVPIFPDLRPFLEDAIERVGCTGAVHVVGGFGERSRQKVAASKYGWNAVGVGTPFGKLVKRAGFELWPKLMHNMRASCETDLATSHPIHVVAAWMGHTPNVALGHYLQTHQGDVQKALAAAPTPRSDPGKGGATSTEVAQKAAQSGADCRGLVGTGDAGSAANRGTLSGPAPASPHQSTCTDIPDRSRGSCESAYKSRRSRDSRPQGGSDCGSARRSGSFPRVRRFAL